MIAWFDFFEKLNFRAAKSQMPSYPIRRSLTLNHLIWGREAIKEPDVVAVVTIGSLAYNILNIPKQYTNAIIISLTFMFVNNAGIANMEIITESELLPCNYYFNYADRILFHFLNMLTSFTNGDKLLLHARIMRFPLLTIPEDALINLPEGRYELLVEPGDDVGPFIAIKDKDTDNVIIRRMCKTFY